MESAGEKILIEGNKAAALGVAVRRGERADLVPDHPVQQPGGVRRGIPQEAPGQPGRQAKTFAIVQAEDELAAVGMAIGAGWAGARALTATAGPGISLMSEFVGLAYFAEIPVVIIDVQRMGPSTGLPTRTSQGDILKLHLLGHGDSRHIVLIPGLGRGVLLADHRGPRPGAAVPDPGVRRHRPRPGHEPLAQRPVPLSHQADPARQGA